LSDKQEGRQTHVSIFFSTSSQHPCAGHLAPALAVIVRIHIGSSDREKTRESRGKRSVTTKRPGKLTVVLILRKGRADEIFDKTKLGGQL
jgi:hypothetical protein